MTPEAEAMHKTALQKLRQIISSTMTAHQHSYAQAAAAMGFHNKNTVYRIANPYRERENGQHYEPVANIRVFAAALDYGGKTFADLGDAGDTGKWTDVVLAIFALPVLSKNEQAHLVNILNQHYAFLCDNHSRKEQVSCEIPLKELDA